MLVASGVLRPDLHFPGVAPGFDELRPGLIVYEGLPAGAHGLGRQSPMEAWERISGFLDSLACIDSFDANLSLAHPGWRPSGDPDAVHSAITSRFGHSRRRLGGLVNRWGGHMWSLDRERVSEATECLQSAPALPDVGDDPSLMVSVEVMFKLRAPGTDHPLPFQNLDCYGHQDIDGYGVVGLGESRLYARLLASGRSTCAITLSLPFVEPIPEARELAAVIDDALPMKLSSHHWRQLRLNKGGTAYYARKITVL